MVFLVFILALDRNDDCRLHRQVALLSFVGCSLDIYSHVFDGWEGAWLAS